MPVSTTITTNIFQYIEKILNLKKKICLYQKLSNYLNIIYTITPIQSLEFEKLNFLLAAKIDAIINIEKIMIIAHSIQKCIALKKHLSFFLSDNLKDRGKKVLYLPSQIWK